MKNYQLNESPGGKLQKIGSIKFTFDKAFFRTKFDNIPKYVATRISINIFSNSTPEKELDFIAANYRNPRDFEIIFDKKIS